MSADFSGKRAVIMARTSSPDSVMDPQVRLCQRWAEAHSVTITAVICDIAPAHSKMSERGNAAAWLKEADLVASYDLILGSAPSRLFTGSRNLAELMAWAQRNAKVIVTADGAMDTTEPVGVMAARMLSVFGDIEAAGSRD
jgi:hypothetical protein